MIHAIITFVLCLFLLLIGLPYLTVLFPVFFYFGREHAQAEYRYIESHGGKRGDCPKLCGFMPQAWNAKALFDCFLPVLASVAAVFVSYALKWLQNAF